MLAGILPHAAPGPAASMQPVGIRNGVPLLPRVAVEHHAHVGKAAGGYSSSAFSNSSATAWLNSPTGVYRAAHSVEKRGAEDYAI